ncbi:MAG: DUF4381 domain-containing protein [gamma proteobacterium symbiont of Lucinoma myriamae]|nr:DUF4381 domain-containing protein [gamma proteobacterium symbiont of Lucinoma myriamae]MCU7818307.1 DUF4381 domain-containing protein [gamma proteobacterium symbiont of Lucinoma myriamae]MCU7833338.1 DUF4381 domain-containing protein [gamma proteobacterium symbiont of Lucinoma myriamae]
MPAPQTTPHQAFQDPTQAMMHNAPQMPASSPLDPSKLADIQLPEAITFWPPAPGWWLLLALSIIILFVIIYFIKRKPPIKTATVKQLKSQSMKELHDIKERYKAQLIDKEASNYSQKKAITHASVKELSIFLRRYALSLYHREKVASLTDQQWLALLDNTYYGKPHSNQNTPLFSEKYADLLTQTPYQSVENVIDHVLLDELFASSESLIKKSAQLFALKNTRQEKQDV